MNNLIDSAKEMKLQESTSIGIILIATSIVVGYLAYLDASPIYWAIAVLLFAIGILNGRMMKAFRAAVSEEKRTKGSFFISLLACILMIIGIANLQGTNTQPIGFIGLLVIFGGICLNSLAKMKQLKQQEAEPADRGNG